MPDAQLAGPPVSWRERRLPPRHAPVWVRIAGSWHRGLIQYWIMPAGGSWEVVITADEPPGSPPWQGRYIFDAAAIRPGHGDDRPA